MFKTISRCLSATELKFRPTLFIASDAIYEVLIRQLILVPTPGMRENGVGRDVSACALDKAEGAIVYLQEPHKGQTLEREESNSQLHLRDGRGKGFVEIDRFMIR